MINWFKSFHKNYKYDLLEEIVKISDDIRYNNFLLAPLIRNTNENHVDLITEKYKSDNLTSQLEQI